MNTRSPIVFVEIVAIVERRVPGKVAQGLPSEPIDLHEPSTETIKLVLDRLRHWEPSP